MIGDASITVTARGSRPAASAWERYADLDQWARWAPQIRGVDTDGPRRLTPGLTGRVRGPVGVGVNFVVDAVDEPARTWAWTVTLGPLRLRLHHEVHAQGPQDGAGSVTLLRLHGPLPVLLGYAPVTRFALHRLVSGTD